MSLGKPIYKALKRALLRWVCRMYESPVLVSLAQTSRDQASVQQALDYLGFQLSISPTATVSLGEAHVQSPETCAAVAVVGLPHVQVGFLGESCSEFTRPSTRTAGSRLLYLGVQPSISRTATVSLGKPMYVQSLETCTRHLLPWQWWACRIPGTGVLYSSGSYE